MVRINFTKMHGAGNDFVVLDETRERLALSAAQYRYLADRHRGVGADQILCVRPAPVAQQDVDFEYVIHNADGQEVEQCGNGSRCFVRYVHEQGLSPKTTLRVLTKAGIIEPSLLDNGQVKVNMGPPIFDLAQIPFNPLATQPISQGAWQLWPLQLTDHISCDVAVLSMGNPHAVTLVANVDTAPVQAWGELIEQQAQFPRRVNAGFMQILDRQQVRLRVFERGAGETLACGTGACAAVVAGIRLGLLDELVKVQTRGGALYIEWSSQAPNASVWMTGPAVTVFAGSIDIPDL
jgi:diaminopimelate epimerase